MLSISRRALRDTRGALSITVAVTAAVMIVAGGIALDVLRANQVRAKLQAAADAAALEAANGTVMNFSKVNDRTRRARAVRAFSQNSVDLVTASISRPVVTISRKKSSISAKVAFTAEVDSFFGRLFGMETFTVTGDAVATSGSAPYINLVAIVDNSMSMGIGHTRADQDKMLADNGVLAATNNKSGPCAVACHSPAEDTYSYYRTRGVTFRLDVVRSALLNVIDGLRTDTVRASKAKVAVTTTEEVYETAPVSFAASLGEAVTKTRAIDLASKSGGTNLSLAFKKANEAIVKIGDGSSPDKPLPVVLLLSDGFEHFGRGESYHVRSADSAADPRFPNDQIMQNMALDECEKLKARGIRVMMLNTNYEIPVKAWNWETGKIVDWDKIPLAGDVERIRILLDKIPRTEATMMSCASKPEYYLKASSQRDIEMALGDFVNAAFAKRPYLSE